MTSTSANFNKQTLDELSDYFRAAPIGLHVTGPEGTVRWASLAELELLGYGDREDEYIGRHVAEMHVDPNEAEDMFARLARGEGVVEHEAALVRRDGGLQKVLLYANAKTKDGKFDGVRCCTFPHPDDLRPEIARIGASRDESLDSRQLKLGPEEEVELFNDLLDFFENSPVNLHIVGGDGLIRHASKSELASMGYNRGEYVGAHIARFHADQKVIDGMLTDLVSGAPLVNFSATLFHKDGSELPVMIYSNSRMRDGSFVNTRCFTVPIPNTHKAEQTSAPVNFTWPRNEDLGFTVAKRNEATASPDPMTLALRYVAARKRPEESLGFVARVTELLAEARPLGDAVNDVVGLCVPFLADFASVDLEAGHVAHASSSAWRRSADAIVKRLGNGDNPPLDDLGVKSSIVAPLTLRGRSLGRVTLLREDAASRPEFGPADRALADELGRLIAFAVEISRLSSPSPVAKGVRK
jgi:PAS fold/PAS domain